MPSMVLNDADDPAKILKVGVERVEVGTPARTPQYILDEEAPWDVEDFKKRVSIRFHTHTANDNCFSLIGVDASLANAYRRILLAELPHVAIHDVFVLQNTSVIQDEVLAHRLGLIPLKGCKEDIKWLRWRRGPTDADAVGEPASDVNTVVLKLHVKCEWKKDGKKKAKEGVDDINELFTKPNVYASDLEFEPVGQQVDRLFTESRGKIQPVNPDILLAKLRPDQEINLVCYAQKGTGASHAKWSPVATASYRLLPTINIKTPIVGASARKFQKCFPPGVIDLEHSNSVNGSESQGEGDEVRAVVADTLKDTVSRECLRHEEFKDKVKLGRVRDHFIFSVESVGQFDSDELVVDSIKCLRQKCTRLKKHLKDIQDTR